MERKYLDQHVGLAAAAATAHNMLVPGRRSYYDVQHLSDTLNLVAQALARLAPIYVEEPDGSRRALAEEELAGATIERGATVVVLASGRRCHDATVRRDDLRDAIAILKSIGVKAFAPKTGGVHRPKGNAKAED